MQITIIISGMWLYNHYLSLCGAMATNKQMKTKATKKQGLFFSEKRV